MFECPSPREVCPPIAHLIIVICQRPLQQSQHAGPEALNGGSETCQGAHGRGPDGCVLKDDAVEDVPDVLARILGLGTLIACMGAWVSGNVTIVSAVSSK